jgi:hypothetical protein
MYATTYDIRYTGTAAQTGSMSPMQGQVYHTGTGSTSGSYAMFFAMYQATNASALNFMGASTAAYIVDQKNGTVQNYYGYFDTGIDTEDGRTINAYNFYGSAHQVDATAAKGKIKNAYGLYLIKQTVGNTTNTGIRLYGDGIGADIRFGTNGNSRIYASGTKLILNATGGGAGVLVYNRTGYGNITARKYITASNVPKIDGKLATDTFRKVPIWTDGKGNINYTAVYAAVQQTVTDFDRPVVERVCETIDTIDPIDKSAARHTNCRDETTYPYTKRMNGLDLEMRVAELEKFAYESTLRVDALERG